MKLIIPLLLMLVMNTALSQARVVCDLVGEMNFNVNIASKNSPYSPQANAFADVAIDTFIDKDLAGMDSLLDVIPFKWFQAVDVYLGYDIDVIQDFIRKDTDAYFIRSEVENVLVIARFRREVILVMIYSL